MLEQIFEWEEMMKEIVTCIEELRHKLDRHRKENLKEYPTRTIFIDPMLQALGWDVRELDEVQLEYSTIDGKSVDYALKLNRRPVLFVEAKCLNDPLTDVKSITQVVGYAANAGVEWCILTNGITYKVYRSTEKAKAPDKLLFEVSIDPKESENRTTQKIAELLGRFSRNAMEKGVLDGIGEQVFTTAKVRKALDKLFLDPPSSLIKMIRSVLNDDSIKPGQVKAALQRVWTPSSEVDVVSPDSDDGRETEQRNKVVKAYGERHHLEGKPREIIELFWAADRYCRELAPNEVQRTFLAKYVRYMHGKSIFCCTCVQKSGLRVWLKLDYSKLEDPPEFARDVSNIGHWGVGDVEVRIDSLETFQRIKPLIRKSFEENK